ncbi:hypothetical protein [Tropicimonas sp. IMCC34043]|uniref:hypothetical protein n=1 Tax=Tropicimonas sp. IMCC34043 TaxID=2248760 RepID=UPI000E234BF1|nr:hypothetical protein [Tropicimonas sp. IMCC34043]
MGTKDYVTLFFAFTAFLISVTTLAFDVRGLMATPAATLIHLTDAVQRTDRQQDVPASIEAQFVLVNTGTRDIVVHSPVFLIFRGAEQDACPEDTTPDLTSVELDDVWIANPGKATSITLAVPRIRLETGAFILCIRADATDFGGKEMPVLFKLGSFAVKVENNQWSIPFYRRERQSQQLVRRQLSPSDLPI